MDKLRVRFQKQSEKYKHLSLFHLLVSIRDNYLEYLPIKSIRCLDSFLGGYKYVEYSQSPQKEPNLEEEYFNQFVKWVAEKYQINSAHSYVSIILFYSQNEVEAFDNFYKLLEEFQSAYPWPLEINKTSIEEEQCVEHPYSSQLINVIRYDRDLYGLLKDIKKIPYLYLNSYSLTHLYCYLQGYAQAKMDYALAISLDEKRLLTFLSSIKHKYREYEGQNWLKTILFYSEDEKKALDRFFELLEEDKRKTGHV